MTFAAQPRPIDGLVNVAVGEPGLDRDVIVAVLVAAATAVITGIGACPRPRKRWLGLDNVDVVMVAVSTEHVAKLRHRHGLSKFGELFVVLGSTMTGQNDDLVDGQQATIEQGIDTRQLSLTAGQRHHIASPIGRKPRLPGQPMLGRSNAVLYPQLALKRLDHQVDHLCMQQIDRPADAIQTPLKIINRSPHDP